ncbi:MAG: hypothetical protein J0L92_16025 [Deltaproteobacteria bacterium]|nr:hypothetical protein [Deltaproteobacteria bacterium]
MRREHLRLVSADSFSKERERLCKEGFACRVLRTHGVESEHGLMVAIRSSLPLDPAWGSDVPARINWDSILDRISGGFYIGDNPSAKVVLLWEGAVDVESWSPRVFADLLYLMGDVIERVAGEGVTLEVLVHHEDSRLFDALPDIGPQDFDAWRASVVLPPPRGRC